MRVAVVGLGGVGGYIAANLVKAGVDVVGFARGEHLKAIQKDGLKIVEDAQCWCVQIDTREEDDLDGYFEGAFDVVLFCVKSYDLVESFTHIESHIDTNTTLLSLANGVDNAATLRSLSGATVLDGCVYILSHIEKAGVIRKKGKVFALVFNGKESATQKLATLFEKANLRYKNPADIQTALWKKYIFIAAFATLCSYYEQSIGAIYAEHKQELQTLLEEIATYAKTEGVNIDDEVQKTLETAAKLPYDSLPSMALDFQNKKRVELDALSGKVKMPLMQKLYKALQARV